MGEVLVFVSFSSMNGKELYIFKKNSSLGFRGSNPKCHNLESVGWSVLTTKLVLPDNVKSIIRGVLGASRHPERIYMALPRIKLLEVQLTGGMRKPFLHFSFESLKAQLGRERQKR